MRGRKPKPTAFKKLSGNPGKRALNKNEPTPAPKIPDCPSHLNKVAEAEWKRVTKELAALNMIGEIDRAALAAYCVAWSVFVEATETLETEGAVSENAQGSPIRNPWALIQKQAMDQVIAFSAQFGMTPSARSRVSVTPPVTPEEELEGMLGLFPGKKVKVVPAK